MEERFNGYEEEIVDLLYCGGDEQYEEILLSLLSVLRRTKRRLRVYLLTAALNRYDGKPLCKAKTAYLQGLLRDIREGSDLSVWDLTDEFKKSQFESVACLEEPYAYLLLFLDCIAQDLPTDKLLYLNGKTLAAGDVGKLYDFDLGENAYGAVQIPLMRAFLTEEILCGGAFLFNMSEALKNGLFIRARRCCKENGYQLSPPSALYFSRCRVSVFERALLGQRYLGANTLLRYYGGKQFLGFRKEKKNITDKKSLTNRERFVFSGDYDQFFLYRDGYLRTEGGGE